MNCNIDITGVVLKTERLILREWRLSDLEDFYEYYSVDGVGQMAGWLPHKDREESLRILNHFIDGKHTFALEYQGKVIGSLGLEAYTEDEYPELQKYQGREIGYVLSKDYWGRGLMPEAVREAMRYMFEDVGVDFLLCGHFLSNRQSARVQQKRGFRYYRNNIHHGITGDREGIMNFISRKQWLEMNEH